ncbi:hypothetical protein [Kamptonema sp. UHCC 0994]|uniref:hypothetical protein n=1 Tax=Kamptonema sp. UHCC 0994 TaxID=3031329 RepID=UPI0023B9EB9E|nr:hypothetical protein [Kamptonema sp. UHCC 0994]MDF0551761.1 hypothetical protein [Kamptonema sp. UHCC 0994]
MSFLLSRSVIRPDESLGNCPYFGVSDTWHPPDGAVELLIPFSLPPLRFKPARSLFPQWYFLAGLLFG